MDEDVFRGKLKQYKDTVYRIAFTYLRNQADAECLPQPPAVGLVSESGGTAGKSGNCVRNAAGQCTVRGGVLPAGKISGGDPALLL